MPSLIETYSKTTGLKIDKPWMKEDFYPLPFQKYIVLPAGSAQASKCYDYFQEVINLLNPILNKYQYSIVLLGGKDEPLLSGVYDLRGKTNIAQSYYILRKSKLFFGNDSWTAHAAGWSNLPIVVLYGSTDKYIHGPYWKNENKSILLESHRKGNHPSFSFESPKTVNFIPPEDVVNSVLKLLDLEDRVNIETKFIGQFYQHSIVEIIPNTLPDLSNFNNIPFAIRMDYQHDESILQSLLQNGKQVNILTKKEINLNLINAFKKQILSYNHEIDENCSPTYIKQLKTLLPKAVFFTKIKDEKQLSELRLKFFDVSMIEHVIDKTKKDFCSEVENYTNKKLDGDINIDNMFIKTNKYILSKDKVYLSYAHLKNDIPAGSENSSKVFDDDELWKDMNHFLFYTTK